MEFSSSSLFDETSAADTYKKQNIQSTQSYFKPVAHLNEKHEKIHIQNTIFAKAQNNNSKLDYYYYQDNTIKV